MRRERAPRWLPDEGQTLWRSLRGELVSLGLLTEVDEAAFNLMCFHYALALKAGLQMMQDGLTVLSGMTGDMRKHPASQIWRENSQMFQRYAVEFGLTPSSRSKIKVERQQEQSLAEMLFAGIDAGSTGGNQDGMQDEKEVEEKDLTANEVDASEGGASHDVPGGSPVAED